VDPGSISAGEALAKSTVHLTRTLCPSEHIVLAGYSQGAMVMHRVLDDLIAEGDPATLRVAPERCPKGRPFDALCRLSSLLHAWIYG
jgi:hypothetical protein